MAFEAAFLVRQNIRLHIAQSSICLVSRAVIEGLQNRFFEIWGREGTPGLQNLVRRR